MCPSVAPIAKYISITAAGSIVICTAARYYLSYNLKRYCHANGYKLHYGDGGEFIIRDMLPDSCEIQHLQPDVINVQPTAENGLSTSEGAPPDLLKDLSGNNPGNNLTAPSTSSIVPVHVAGRRN